MKHLAFHAFQSQDGDVDRRDDPHAEECGTPYLARAFANQILSLLQVQQSATRALPVGQHPHVVFHQDHGAIHDQPEIQGTEAHEIGRDPEALHPQQRRGHGQWNHESREQGGPEVAQKQEQDNHHQERTFHQACLHRPNGTIDKTCPIVDSRECHALRQRWTDIVNRNCRRLGHFAGIGSLEHHHRTQHDLLALGGRSACGQLRAPHHASHLGKSNSNAVLVGDHHAGQFAGFGGLTRKTHQHLLAASFDITCSDIFHVLADRLEKVFKGHATSGHAQWIGNHLDHLVATTGRVHLGHPWQSTQLRLDDPVVDGLEFARIRDRFGSRCVRLQGVEEDLAQPRADGPHRGPYTFGQGFARLHQSLPDLGAGEVDVGAFIENRRDLRKSVATQRACRLQSRNPRELGFQRQRHTFFHLLWSEPGGFGVDLDLHVGDVGNRVDGQMQEAKCTRPEQHHRRGQNHAPVPYTGRQQCPEKSGFWLSVHVRPRSCQGRP